MNTQTRINKKQHQVNRYEKNLALQKLKLRKTNTRKKIEFGGLVVKAKMDNLPKAVILGALLDALEQIDNQEGAYQLFKLKGEASFLGFKES